MERQCRLFQARESDFWKRQSTTPAERQNAECLEVMKRQISCPTPSSQAGPQLGTLPRIQDVNSSEGTPAATPFGSRQTSHVTDDQEGEGPIETAICTVVGECHLSVSVADPCGMDVELIAVSEGFSRTTGYGPKEVLGENC